MTADDPVALSDSGPHLLLRQAEASQICDFSLDDRRIAVEVTIAPGSLSEFRLDCERLLQLRGGFFGAAEPFEDNRLPQGLVEVFFPMIVLPCRQRIFELAFDSKCPA